MASSSAGATFLSRQNAAVPSGIQRDHDGRRLLQETPLEIYAVTGTRPNYLWRKWATAVWLRKQEAALALFTGGAHALIERPGRARISVEFFCASRRRARALQEIFGGTVTRLPSDWEARFFAAHKTKPLRIGRRLTIRSELGPVSETPLLLIPAGAAFGTGEHATTAMSLRLLEQVTRSSPPGWRMLDAGTGSGILALAGKRFGAGNVLAIENDPLALRTAKFNAGANRIHGIDFRVADVKEVAGRFDLITANLFSELLIRVFPRFRRCLRSDGRLILSGVLRRQELELRRALRSNGFRVLETRRRRKWIALLSSL